MWKHAVPHYTVFCRIQEDLPVTCRVSQSSGQQSDDFLNCSSISSSILVDAIVGHQVCKSPSCTSCSLIPGPPSKQRNQWWQSVCLPAASSWLLFTIPALCSALFLQDANAAQTVQTRRLQPFSIAQVQHLRMATSLKIFSCLQALIM